MFFFYFFCIPKLYLWGSPSLVRFLRMWPFLNPTIEVVTFRLHGWLGLKRNSLQTASYVEENTATAKLRKLQTEELKMLWNLKPAAPHWGSYLSVFQSSSHEIHPYSTDHPQISPPPPPPPPKKKRNQSKTSKLASTCYNGANFTIFSYCLSCSVSLQLSRLSKITTIADLIIFCFKQGNFYQLTPLSKSH